MLTKTNHGATVPLSEVPIYSCPHCSSNVTRPSKLIRGTYFCPDCEASFYPPQDFSDGI